MSFFLHLTSVMIYQFSLNSPNNVDISWLAVVHQGSFGILSWSSIDWW